MADPAHLLDALSADDARAALARCCGARRWVDGMLARRPYGTRDALHRAADEVWAQLGRDDYLEAFSHHPRIGADLAALRARFAATASWSSAEQAGVAEADEATLARLAAGNRAYEARFGFLFLVCAQGLSAGALLDALEARLANDPGAELGIAAREQAKITHLRLEKLA